MDQETRRKVFSIIQSEINLNPEEIDPHQDIRKNAILDSMQFVSLLAKLELELNVDMPVSLLEVNTLQEFLEGIDKILVSKS
jgi:acyl carrier protein